MIMPPHPGLIDMDNHNTTKSNSSTSTATSSTTTNTQQNIVLVVVLRGSVWGTIPGERRAGTWSAHLCSFLYTAYCICIYRLCVCVYVFKHINI